MDNKWQELWHRIKHWVPQLIIDRIDGKKSKNEDEPSHLFTYATTGVIVALTISSVLNMDETTGRVLAVCVPLSVFVGAHRWGALNPMQRAIAWVIALTSVIWSAFLQYGAYVEGPYSVVSMFSLNGDLNALTMALALPLSECSMAILAAMVASSAEREHEQRKRKKEAEERSAKMRKADEEDREAERRRIQELRTQQDALSIEQQRRQVEADHAARMAEIDTNKQAKLIDAEAKAQAKVVKAGVKNRATDRAKTDTVIVQDGKRTKQVQMIELYRADPSLPLAKVGEALDVSKSTARNYRDELVQLEVLDLHGEGKAQLVKVNGQSDAFLSGKLG